MADHLPGTDPATNTLLAQTREGNRCKFVMIANGAEILRLIGYCEGLPRDQVQIARKEGHEGPAYWGVITGDGANLTFHLCPRDGFTKPPVDEQTTKSFLADTCNMSIEVAYAITDELPDLAGGAGDTPPSVTPEPIAEDPPPPAQPDAVAEEPPPAPAEEVAEEAPAPESVAEEPPEPETEPAPEPELQPTDESPAPASSPAEPASAPSGDDATTRVQESEARQRTLKKLYHDLPSVLQYTTLDSSIGPCTKLTPDQRYSAEAQEYFVSLINESAEWLRNEASEHPQHAGMVREINHLARAERAAIKQARAEEGARTS